MDRPSGLDSVFSRLVLMPEDVFNSSEGNLVVGRNTGRSEVAGVQHIWTMRFLIHVENFRNSAPSDGDHN